MPTKIVLSGTDKQKLGLFAAKIRRWRKPEPYRGKVSYQCNGADDRGSLWAMRRFASRRLRRSDVYSQPELPSTPEFVHVAGLASPIAAQDSLPKLHDPILVTDDLTRLAENKIGRSRGAVDVRNRKVDLDGLNLMRPDINRVRSY
jgi:hypothetical protein